jgi:hypothetical protein
MISKTGRRVGFRRLIASHVMITAEFANASDPGDHAPRARRLYPQEFGNKLRKESAGARRAACRHARGEMPADSRPALKRRYLAPHRTLRQDQTDAPRTNQPLQQPLTQLQAEREPAAPLSSLHFAADIIPGDRRGGILDVFRPSSIQLTLLFGGEGKRCHPLSFAETVPQRHRKFGSNVGRKLQQFGQGCGRHAFILARSTTCGKKTLCICSLCPGSSAQRSNGQRSPAAAHDRIGGRLVQRVLGSTAATPRDPSCNQTASERLVDRRLG